ncbi:MAG: D-2-hydroxyacid dehydrogenase [Bacillota bacterium]|jgi:glycerate dehydrogenase|nr:D-2-hydroxyacid dehydrogenase [Bacillota bacterium]
MSKIVVLDGYTLNPGDLSWEGLEQLGDLTVYDRTSEDQIVSRIGDAEYVFVNKVPITRATLDACPNVKFIGVLATGYNIVDVEAAKEKGIIVSNVPTYGTDSVAQFVFALLLEICHHVGHHSQAVFEGRWTTNQDWCFWDYPLIELAGKTMGIIGFGRIGRATARIARAFGMEVVAHDNYAAGDTDGFRLVELDELLATSDVISLHVPLTPETKGLINKETIAKMKDGVIIINTARGPLIVEEDLKAALDSGKVYAAGLDVVSVEPIRKDNVLLTCKNVFLTPHIAWAPKESRQRLMDITVENLRQFMAGNPINVVNR